MWELSDSSLDFQEGDMDPYMVDKEQKFHKFCMKDEQFHELNTKTPPKTAKNLRFRGVNLHG